MKQLLEGIKVIAFDADDTLWDNQTYFNQVEKEYCELLSDYGSAQQISAALFETESGNMPLLGYGCKAFTISLVENALKVSHGKVNAETIGNVVKLGKRLLMLDSAPLEGVAATLETLQRSGRYQLALFTKGEILDQENKLHRSGLRRYFDYVSVVSDKTESSYRRLCKALGVETEALCMVGNSFKSDIAPALAVGASAIHVPFHTMWRHEQTETFDHPKLRTVRCFSDILDVIPMKP